MAYNSGSGQSSSRQGNSLLIGILLGVVFGLVIAGGVAWYLQSSRGTIIQPEAGTPQKPVAEAPPVSAPAPAVAQDRPRFEFYKVLTDKDAPTASKDGSKSATGGKTETERAVAKEVYYLQAGSFSNADDADKLKAKLAMLGMEASIQIATIPDKGGWHRVRLGPYKGAEEKDRALAMLQQNGVDAVPMRAQ